LSALQGAAPIADIMVRFNDDNRKLDAHTINVARHLPEWNACFHVPGRKDGAG
jgi:hypothetical protein